MSGVDENHGLSSAVSAISLRYTRLQHVIVFSTSQPIEKLSHRQQLGKPIDPEPVGQHRADCVEKGRCGPRSVDQRGQASGASAVSLG